MHTQIKKPPVRQQQAHEPKRPTNSQQKHVDKRPAAQRMAALQRLAATRARPQDQKIAQLKSLADANTHDQLPIQRQPTNLKAQMGAQYGVDLSGVKEVPNSSFPRSVGALATIQGNRIDYAPSQFTTANRKHELGHAIDNAKNGTPKGDTLVNGQNVDTTREHAAQKIADIPLQQKTMPTTFVSTANEGPLQRRPIEGEIIVNNAPVYIQIHNKTAEAEAEAAEPAITIGKPVSKDKKLRQIGCIDGKKGVTVEDSVMRGDRVALDLSKDDVPSVLNLVEGVDKGSFKKPLNKENTHTPYIEIDQFYTEDNEFYYSKATHFKKKADSADEKRKKGIGGIGGIEGKDKKTKEFKKYLFNSFLELKDKDGLKDFLLKTYWEYNDLKDNTDAMLTGHHIGASLRAALGDQTFIGGLEATRLGHFIEQMFTFDALNDYFKEVKDIKEGEKRVGKIESRSAGKLWNELSEKYSDSPGEVVHAVHGVSIEEYLEKIQVPSTWKGKEAAKVADAMRADAMEKDKVKQVVHIFKNKVIVHTQEGVVRDPKNRDSYEESEEKGVYVYNDMSSYHKSGLFEGLPDKIKGNLRKMKVEWITNDADRLNKDLGDDRIDKPLSSLGTEPTALLDVRYRTINWKMVEEGANSKTFTARNALMKMFKLKAYEIKILKENEKQKNTDKEIVKKAKEERENLEKQKAQFEKRSYVRDELANNEYIAYKNAFNAFKILKELKHIEGNPENEKEKLALTLFFVNMRDNTWKKETIEGVLNKDKKTIKAFLELKNHEDLSSRDLYSNL